MERGGALVRRLLAESLVPSGLFSRGNGALLDPDLDGALKLCVLKGDQEPEWELCKGSEVASIHAR